MDQPTPIKDMDHYTTEMLKSLVDKVYFLDKTDAGLFVDFGCADGVMLGFIHRVFPEIKLVGYDNDEEMLKRARENNPGKDITFTSSWEEVAEIVDLHRDNDIKSCLVLSSVIHEAYSYLTDDEVALMWSKVWGNDKVRFDYIAIRDMMVSRATTRPADPLQVACIRQRFDIDRLDEWEAQWGSIEEDWSLTHLLLTYSYKLSWARELVENYLPINYEKFLASVPDHYIPIFKEHYTLPFLQRQVKKDFRIYLSDRTHLKLVLEAVN